MGEATQDHEPAQASAVQPNSRDRKILDTLVIGAGPAGLGTALALDVVEDLLYGVVDRGKIGQTFLDWPEHQTFLTPSFTGNGFGATDLNAIHPLTSPAYSLGVDYPTGRQYATYLRSVSRYFEIPVVDSTEVTWVQKTDEGFLAKTSNGEIPTRTLVWAGGEFSDTIPPELKGKTPVVHSSAQQAWEPREGHVVILGGYESGIDIACHHIDQGAAKVTVLDANKPWEAGTGSDPSFELAPRSRMKLAKAQQSGRLELKGFHAKRVQKTDGGYEIELEGGGSIVADHAPIAGTGFGPGLGPVAHLFDSREDGWPLVDDNDQSTIAEGLFLTGPALRHGNKKFCFIYKFRQRYAHIASVIGAQLGKNTENLQAWKDAGMWADDIDSCGADCKC